MAAQDLVSKQATDDFLPILSRGAYLFLSLRSVHTMDGAVNTEGVARDGGTQTRWLATDSLANSKQGICQEHH